MLLLTVLLGSNALLGKLPPNMTHNFHEAISSLHLQDPASSSSPRSSAEPRSYESASSVDSSYTRRGQTESEADIRGSLAAARDLATRKKRLDVDQLSSSPRPRDRQDPLSLEEEEDNQSTASGSKTPLPDTSGHCTATSCLPLLILRFRWIRLARCIEPVLPLAKQRVLRVFCRQGNAGKT